MAAHNLYALEDRRLVTVVGAVQHRPDGLHALLPPAGQRFVGIYGGSPRVARARPALHELAACASALAALGLIVAAWRAASSGFAIGLSGAAPSRRGPSLDDASRTPSSAPAGTSSAASQ